MATEHVPPSAALQITNAARVAADRLFGIDQDTLAERLRFAHRVDRYKDGLRLWHIEGGWVAVHEVRRLDGSKQLLQATVIDAFAEDSIDGRWRQTADVPAPKHRKAPSGPRARAR